MRMDKKRKHSALYRYIESLQGDRPWGTVLDAGTGVNSIRWLSELSTERWTDVTGSRGEARLVHEALGPVSRPEDRVELGNWADNQFLKDEVYDTVFADYLLGAVEVFSPYFQSYLFFELTTISARTSFLINSHPLLVNVNLLSTKSVLSDREYQIL